MHKINAILLVLIMLLGCKKQPKEAYKQITNTKRVVHSFKAALARTSQIEVIQQNQIYSRKISLEDSIINVEKGWYSNYHILKLPLERKQNYQISIKSLCDCFGVRKYMFFPQLALFDSSSNSVELNLADERVGEPKGITPIHLKHTYTFQSDITASYYLFVYANNTILNRQLAQSTNKAPIHTDHATFWIDIPYEVKAYPVGKYEVSFGYL